MALERRGIRISCSGVEEGIWVGEEINCYIVMLHGDSESGTVNGRAR